MFKFKRNQSINKWVVSYVKSEEYDHKPDTMDYDGYDKLCGFTPRVYPCREQFVANHTVKGAIFPSDTIFKCYYLEQNNKVEFTSFIPIATYVSCYAKTTLVAKPGIHTFKIHTCGGVKIWNNGDLVDSFEHYDRNNRGSFEFEINLIGENELIIFFDDLIERDGNYYFELECTSDDVIVKLPNDNFSTGEFISLNNNLNNIYLEKTSYQNEDIYIVFPNPINYDLDVTVTLTADFISHRHREFKLKYVKGSNKLKVCHCDELKSDFYFFQCKIECIGFNKQVKLATEVFNKKKALVYSMDSVELSTRVKNYMNFVADEGDENSFTMLALLNSGSNKKKFNEIFELEYQRIIKKEDCSDFYLIPLLHMYFKYSKHEFMTAEISKRIEELIFNFRFWYDEPGTDVMWYFSENHALLFYTLKYVVGVKFPNITFKNSGKNGTQMKDEVYEHIIKWLTEFSQDGLVEWNSTSYIPIDLIGLTMLNIYGDEKVKDLSKKCIDLLFEVINEYSINGYMNGATQGRAYEKALRARYTDPIAAINYIYFNEGGINAFSKGVIMLLEMEYYAKNRSPINESERIHGDVQKVKTKSLKSKYHMITSVIDYKIGEIGYQEHIAGVVLENQINIWVNHPGEESVIGNNRPSFWGGNGIIPEVTVSTNNLTYIYDLKHNDYFPNYTHAHFPIDQFDEVELGVNYAIGYTKHLIVKITCDQELNLVKSGASANHELRAIGNKVKWEIDVNER